MRYVVRSIQVVGFGSYRDPASITLDAQGAVGITGLNGAGKSTIVSKALTWCLYGKCAPERHGASTGTLRGNDVINDDAKEAQVEVILAGHHPETGEDYPVSIRRQRVSGKGDRIEVHDLDSTALLGEDQATIDNLIGCEYDVFVRTVVRGQGDPWNFAEATDGKKREILDAISGADALLGPYEKARMTYRAIDHQVTDLSARCEVLAQQVANQGDAEAVQAQLVAWDAAHGRRVQEAKDEIAALKAALKEAEKHDQAAANLKAARDALVAPTLDMQPYAAARVAARTEWSRLNNEKIVKQVEWDHLDQAHPGTDCPTCGQVVGENAPIAQRRSALLQPLADVGQAEKHAKEAMDKATEAEVQARDWLDQAKAAHNAKLRAIVVPPDRTPMARQAVDNAVRRLTDLKAATNPFEAAVEQARKQAFEARRSLAVYGESRAIALDERTLAQGWVAALGPKGARASLAESALLAIEAEANRWLSALSHGRMSVAFPSTKDGKERIGTVVTHNGVERSLLAFSGGEKRRVNLAVDLGVAAAFTRGGALALSLLVLDEEVFSGMDEPGKLAVVHALTSAGVADVVLIDHDPRLTGALPRTYQATRSPDGWSEIA